MPGTASWANVFAGYPAGTHHVFEAQKRVFELARALDQATGSMPRLHSSHAITMECDLLDKGKKKWLRQEGRDALY